MDYPQPITTAQNFTAGWVDLGGEIPSFGWDNLTIWLDITKNNSTGLQVRFVHLHTSGGDEYNHINEVVASGITSTYIQHYLLEDTDQKIIIDHRLFNTANYCKCQIKCAVVGVTPAVVDDAKYSLG